MLFTHYDSGLVFSKYFDGGGGHHGFYCHHLRDLIQFEHRCRLVQQRPVRDDLSTTALFYLHRPEGVAASCLANDQRKTPGHKWPLVER